MNTLLYRSDAGRYWGIVHSSIRYYFASSRCLFEANEGRGHSIFSSSGPLPTIIVTQLAYSRSFFREGGEDRVLEAHASKQIPSTAAASSPPPLPEPLHGVFSNRFIPKFTPLHIIPQAVVVAKETEANRSAGVKEEPCTSGHGENVVTVSASPPYLVDLVRASKKRLSLRRFLALRHCWLSGEYFHVPTTQGWYLLAPSWHCDSALLASTRKKDDKVEGEEGLTEGGGASATAVSLSISPPVSPDTKGLVRWCQRVHPRHVSGPAELSPSTAEEEAAQFRREAAAALREASMATEWEQKHPQHHSEARSEEGGAESEDEAMNGAEGAGNTEGKRVKPRRRRRHSSSVDVVWSIPESHLFELNDGIQWPQSPVLRWLKELRQSSGSMIHLSDAQREALTCFFEIHRSRMEVYDENGGGWSLEEEDAFIQSTLDAWRAFRAYGSTPASPCEAASTQEEAKADSHSSAEASFAASPCAQLPTEKEVLSFSRRLFRAYTRKANVQLVVEETTQLVTVVPLVDLPEGTELTLHYGREWWTEHFLFPLLLLLPTNAWVRRLERLVALPSDCFEAFPVIVVKKKRKEQQQVKNELEPSPKKYLYNTLLRKRASNTAVLAFSLQQSILFPSHFLSFFVGSSGGACFNAQQPDEEISMKRLRRTVLRALESFPRNSSSSAPSTSSIAFRAQRWQRTTYPRRWKLQEMMGEQFAVASTKDDKEVSEGPTKRPPQETVVPWENELENFPTRLYQDEEPNEIASRAGQKESLQGKVGAATDEIIRGV